MEPTRNDLELTLKELKGQRAQFILNLEVVAGGIAHIENMLSKLPKKEEIKTE